MTRCTTDRLKTAALLVPLLAAIFTAAADEGAPAQPRPCRLCSFEAGASGEVEAGFGYLFDDGYCFGDYSGLEGDGLFLIAHGSARWREADGSGYFDAQARDLGIDARSLALDGGRQGLFGVHFAYDALPRRINDSGRTPFLGAGGAQLALPSGWTRGASTQDMPDLDASLRALPIEAQRERYRAAFSFVPAERWTTALTLRRDQRSGLRPVGGSFITLASLLPQPVDAYTDQLDFSAALSGALWQFAAGYHASFYRSDHAGLAWTNPFNAPGSGPDLGQMALPPDNHFHQLSASASAQPAAWARLIAHLAGGRMLQDEHFLPATVNPELATALPRDSLQGRIDTLALRLRGSFGPWAGLRLSADYLLDERDNRTPQDAFEQVITDVYRDAARANPPYDFSREAVRLALDYRLLRMARLSLGVEQERRERSLQARRETDERKLWSRLRLQPAWPVAVVLGYVHADRGGSAFLAPQPGAADEPAALRQYHLADRERDAATFGLSATPLDTLSIGLHASYGRERFPDSTLGLERRRALGYGADLAWQGPAQLSLSGFWARDALEAGQSGSQSGQLFPNWRADSEDDSMVAGLRLERANLFQRCDLGVEYSYARSRGTIVMNTGSADPPFPDLATRRQETRLFALYRLRPHLGIRAEYRYAKYRSSDWALDGVAPDAVHNLLALGQDAPAYHVNLLALSARYEFR